VNRFRAALRASRDIGSFGVITHPLDDSVRAFYGRCGFQGLPFDPHRAMPAVFRGSQENSSEALLIGPPGFCRPLNCQCGKSGGGEGEGHMAARSGARQPHPFHAHCVIEQ
jgi:hypothetical protein